MAKWDPGSPVELIIEIGTAAPLLGFAVAGLMAVPAACLQWVYPNAMAGLAAVIAMIFWMLVAIACGAALWGLIRRRLDRSRRGSQLAAQRSLEDLKALTPGKFEEVVADLFRRQGYRVAEVGGPGDGGVDLVFRKDGPPPVEHLVQCKRYGSRTVGVAECETSTVRWLPIKPVAKGSSSAVADSLQTHGHLPTGNRSA